MGTDGSETGDVDGEVDGSETRDVDGEADGSVPSAPIHGDLEN